MSLLILILALALEQVRPISSRNPLYLAFVRGANGLERNLNAGEYRNGVYAWLIAVLPLLLVTTLGYWLLSMVSTAMAVGWSVLVLYVNMGFRQFSHAFTGISKALQEDDLAEARALLADWTGQPASEMTPDEVARVAIEQGVLDSFRFVFATVFWFLALSWIAGPAGAVLYRAASLLQQRWGRRDDGFGYFANGVLEVLDYIPVRLTAVGYAIMGNFEDAVYCWRTQARHWAHYSSGILLAAAGGALGVKLGEALHQDHTIKLRPEIGVGEPASVDYLPSAVGLVWRTILLWVAVVLLYSLGQWLA
ncbi:CobD/CbiB family protein [Chitinilyticum piscinae]|uniref:Cobalamin biosynthesis protein CobD n=1 Tax=Chitinilyticum piscinae TaxID=2866724 RepID=A0A8J7FIP5_9NEIS|nr:CobD/CbiB family protein [Chitinilyticum piscinae]MBE9608522.1 CobD/CbiB family protein [Chitinilyticum piscinae]